MWATEQMPPRGDGRPYHRFEALFGASRGHGPSTRLLVRMPRRASGELR